MANQKWADYAVTAVRFEDPKVRMYITHLEVREDNGESLGPPTIWTLARVAQAILNGKTFVTAILNAEKKFTKGARVEITLRTRSDATEKNNLENLPLV